VSAPLGMALGLDKATPGLMRLRPRPSDETIVTRSLLATAGLAGLYMAVVLDALIYFGKSHYGSVAVGSSIGLTAFSLMIVVAAFESRSIRLSAVRSDTLDNRTLTFTALAEIVLAVLVTQMDAMRRLLGTRPLTAGQFGLALLAAVVLFGLWELSKWAARRPRS
jgi:Ca2+-transporting ATPase